MFIAQLLHLERFIAILRTIAVCSNHIILASEASKIRYTLLYILYIQLSHVPIEWELTGVSGS